MDRSLAYSAAGWYQLAPLPGVESRLITYIGCQADKTTDALLGCHIIGPAAGDLIMEIAVGIEFSTSTEDIARTSHAHPQLGEAIKEAALAIEGRAIHI